MIDMALDPQTGDLSIESFDIALVDGIDQIAQNLSIRLRFMRGEWYLDIAAGLPYYQYFFIKNPNQLQVETFIKNEIVNTTGINQILNFSSAYDDQRRQFSVNFTCQTDNGNLEITQIL
jgi:hypothetical protein